MQLIQRRKDETFIDRSIVRTHTRLKSRQFFCHAKASRPNARTDLYEIRNWKLTTNFDAPSHPRRMESLTTLRRERKNSHKIKALRQFQLVEYKKKTGKAFCETKLFSVPPKVSLLWRSGGACVVT
jgi:hypothetical protein